MAVVYLDCSFAERRSGNDTETPSLCYMPCECGCDLNQAWLARFNRIQV